MVGSFHLSGEARRWISVYWRRKWLLLAIIVVIPAAVYGISKQVEETYEASSTLVVRPTDLGSSVFSSQTSFTYASADSAVFLVGTAAVADAAAEDLGEPGADISDQIRAEPISSSSGTNEFVELTATANSGRRAAAIADAFAGALTQTRTDEAEAQLQDTIRTLRREAADIEESGGSDDVTKEELARQLQQLRGLQTTQDDATQVIEVAAVPGEPISPQPLRNAALGLVFALLLAAGLAPALEGLDRRIRSEEDLEEALGVPTLAVVPDLAFLPGTPPSNAGREAFQTLRAALTYFNIDRELKVILVCSPAHQEGKTTVATNLAAAMAQDENDVILVDGDLRRPQVASRLGLDGSAGIESVLVDGTDVHDCLAGVEIPGNGSLRALASVNPSMNPAVLLGSNRMKALLEELANESDIVIIDTPPLLAVSDAVPLIRSASGIVMVSRIDSTGRNSLERSAEMIQAARGTLLGGVLTGGKGSGLYGYGAYAYAALREDAGPETAKS